MRNRERKSKFEMRTERVGRTMRTELTGMREGTNMSEERWMKTERWRGRVYVWAKKLKEQVKPNIEGKRGIKSDKEVNWAIISPTKWLARHGTRWI